MSVSAFLYFFVLFFIVFCFSFFCIYSLCFVSSNFKFFVFFAFLFCFVAFFVLFSFGPILVPASSFFRYHGDDSLLHLIYSIFD